MGFDLRNFRFNLYARISLLAGTIFGFYFLLGAGNYPFTLLFVGLVAAVQVKLLADFTLKGNRELIEFLRSIEFDDFTHSFKSKGQGAGFDTLADEFNRVLDKFRELRAQRESEFVSLRNILMHVGIGILSFDSKGQIIMANISTKRMLKVKQLTNIGSLRVISPELHEKLKSLHTGQKTLVRFRRDGELMQIAMYAMELIQQGKEYKLVTIQNISSELEEKEMEAWQNLIRVLTHEIMNSVTPISSLASTLDDEIADLKPSLGEENVEDLVLAVQTIRRRSDNLIHFVNDFRNMTHMPEPVMKHFLVNEMLAEIERLLETDLGRKGVAFEQSTLPDELYLTADRKLIEQVMINLIKNAVEALVEDHSDKPSIKVKGILDPSNHILLSVEDNGPGIEPEALERIFIPFFTTKREGSGIGLSLSRQIMRLHHGNLTVDSEPDKGTKFTLKF